jgi:hypothetical protein
VAKDARTSRSADRPIALLAVLLIVLGILFSVLYRMQNSSEHHSFNAGARQPASVHITAGKQYEISIPGGLTQAAADGISIGSVRCTYTAPGSGNSQPFDITALGAGSRTVHAVATFIGPATGDFRINCAELPQTFVDDADNGAADPAGLFILVATIAFTLGAALGLSALYRRSNRRALVTGGDHSHIATDQ